jgi:putative transposase
VELKSSSHCKYLLNYHIVWCPKFQYKVLKGNIEIELKKILTQISLRYGYDIIEMEVMPDHIHLFLSLKPHTAPSDVVRTLKSVAAIELFKVFPQLKKFYGRSGSLWSNGFFVTTVGNATTQTIQEYIKNQK